MKTTASLFAALLLFVVSAVGAILPRQHHRLRLYHHQGRHVH